MSLFIEDCLVQGERFRGAYPKVEALNENRVTDSQLDALTGRRRLLRVVQHEDTARIELIHDCLVPIVRKARDERKAKEHQAELEQKLNEADARTREKEENNRRLIRWRRGLLIALALSVVTAGFALYQRDLAREDKLRAMATGATSGSYANRERNPELSTLMALQAVSLARATADRTALPRAEDALRRATNYRLQLSLAHDKKLHAVAFSPNGHYLTTASGDNLHVWDVQTGREITPKPMKQPGGINKIVFIDDGSRLVSGGSDDSGSIRLWDTSTGEDKTPKPMSHGAPISALALGPGNLLATGSGRYKIKETGIWQNSRVIFWNIATGDRSGALPSAKGDKQGDQPWIADLAFNTSGSRLAVGEVEMGITTVWDVGKLPGIKAAIPKFSLRNWKPGKDGTPAPDAKMLVDSIAFSPDGRLLATGDRYNSANLWDAKTGAHRKTLFGHTDQVRKVAFSPDGSRMATASADGTASIWDPTTGRMLFSLIAHKNLLRDLAFSPDGNRLATASEDKTAKIWNVAAHADAVFAVAFSPDGKRLATGSGDTTIKIWETGSRRLVATFFGHSNRVHRVAFSPDGNFLASASFDETARIWDLSTGKEAIRPLQYLDREHQYDKVYNVAYSLDGKWLATAGANHNAVVWNAATGSLLFAGRHDGQVSAVAFSPDGTRLAAAGEDGLKLWEVPSGTLVASVTWPGRRRLVDVNFSPDGKRLVMATGKSSILLMDVATRRMTALPPPKPPNDVRPIVMSAQFTPDGKNIMTTGQDPDVKFWDAITGDEVKSLTVHNKKVNDVAVSYDGKWIATASQDGTFHVSPLNTGDLLAIGCGQVNRSLKDVECRRFLGIDKCPPSPCNQAHP